MKNESQEILYNFASQTLPISSKVMPYVSENISQLVRRRLKELGMSKAALAEKVGVSRSYIGDLANQTAKTESGFYRPSPEIVQKLAKSLEISEIEITTALGYTPSKRADSPLVKLGLRFDKLPQSRKEKYQPLIRLMDEMIEEDEREVNQQGS